MWWGLLSSHCCLALAGMLQRWLGRWHHIGRQGREASPNARYLCPLVEGRAPSCLRLPATWIGSVVRASPVTSVLSPQGDSVQGQSERKKPRQRVGSLPARWQEAPSAIITACAQTHSEGTEEMNMLEMDTCMCAHGCARGAHVCACVYICVCMCARVSARECWSACACRCAAGCH